jgi:hypothetical protein
MDYTDAIGMCTMPGLKCTYMAGIVTATCVAPEDTWNLCGDAVGAACTGSIMQMTGEICCANAYQEHAGSTSGCSCKNGQKCNCVNNHVVCSACTAVDASVPDAHPMDAAAVDAAHMDASVMDASIMDAAAMDAQAPDATPMDAAAPDAVAPDAVAPDAAPPMDALPSDAPATDTSTSADAAVAAG